MIRRRCGLVLFVAILHSSIAGQQKEMKHVVGAYINTPMSAMMGATPTMERYGLYYRTNTSNPRRIRLAVVRDIINKSKDATDGLLIDIIAVGDSSLSYNWKQDQEYRNTLRVGMEWRNPSKRVTPVYGFDLITGFRNAKDLRREYTFYYRSTSGVDTNRLLGEKEILSSETLEMVVGAAFAVGWLMKPTAHWELMVSFNPEFYYSFGETKTKLSAVPESVARSSTFDLRLRILEFQLGYIF